MYENVPVPILILRLKCNMPKQRC